MSTKELVQNSFAAVRDKVEIPKQKGKKTNQIIIMLRNTLIW